MLFATDDTKIAPDDSEVVANQPIDSTSEVLQRRNIQIFTGKPQEIRVPSALHQLGLSPAAIRAIKNHKGSFHTQDANGDVSKELDTLQDDASMVSIPSDHEFPESIDALALARRTNLANGTTSGQVMGPDNAVASPSKTGETAFKARKRVALELYSTEVFYVESLEDLMKIRRFLYDKKLLDPYQISLIFSNISRILKIHRRFLKELAAITGAWGPQSCLGTLFVHFAQHFRQYAIYAANFPLADDELSKLLDNSNKHAQLITKRFEALAAKQRGAALDIRSLLIMPVQRIPRYRLFIETLMKITPAHFLDKLLLGKALVVMKDTATFIDNSTRFQEGLFRAKKLQNQITPRIPATATRALVQCASLARILANIHGPCIYTTPPRQGTLMKVSSGFKMLERTFFFFSDCFFVYAHQQKHGTVIQYTKARSDTLVGVETLVRVDNRNKKAICYGALPANSSDLAMCRDVMLKKHAADSEFYLFLVYGKEKQFWINTGNLETLQEWMEAFEWVWPGRPYAESHEGPEPVTPGKPFATKTSGALQVMSARHAIADAIRKGVPMWNKGDFRGCTKVYRDVAVRFAQVEPMLGKALKDIVGKPVDSSRNSQGMLLRNVFNEIRIKYDPVLHVCTTGRPSRRYSTRSSTRNSIASLDSMDSSTLPSWDSEINKTNAELLQVRERAARRIAESQALAPSLESSEATAIASLKASLAKMGMSSDMVEKAKTTPQKGGPLLEVYNAHQAVLRNRVTINQCQATLTKLDQRLGELRVQRTPLNLVMEDKSCATPTNERLESEHIVSASERQPHIGLADPLSMNQQLLNANKKLAAEVTEIKAKIDRMDIKLDLILKMMLEQTSIATAKKRVNSSDGYETPTSSSSTI